MKGKSKSFKSQSFDLPFISMKGIRETNGEGLGGVDTCKVWSRQVNNVDYVDVTVL